MGLREEILAAIDRNDEVELDELLAARPRALRFLMGLSYHEDERLRQRAGRAIALGARHHPRLVQNLARRLVWAMNDESGTNAVTAPAVMLAIAQERPKLLLPLVPDMIRLSIDEALQTGLVQALHTIVEQCPGKVGVELQKSLREQLPKEEYDYDEL